MCSLKALNDKSQLFPLNLSSKVSSSPTASSSLNSFSSTASCSSSLSHHLLLNIFPSAELLKAFIFFQSCYLLSLNLHKVNKNNEKLCKALINSIPFFLLLLFIFQELSKTLHFQFKVISSLQLIWLLYF